MRIRRDGEKIPRKVYCIKVNISQLKIHKMSSNKDNPVLSKVFLLYKLTTFFA